MIGDETAHVRRLKRSLKMLRELRDTGAVFPSIEQIQKARDAKLPICELSTRSNEKSLLHTKRITTSKASFALATRYLLVAPSALVGLPTLNALDHSLD